MRLQIINQLVKEDPQLDARDLLRAGWVDWAVHAHRRSLGAKTLCNVNQALDLEVVHVDPVLQPVLCILPETLGGIQVLGQ